MEPPSENDGQDHQCRNGNEQGPLPCASLPPEQERYEEHNECELKYAENVAVVTSVPIADWAAEGPIRNRPKLASCVVMVGQEVRECMQQA